MKSPGLQSGAFHMYKDTKLYLANFTNIPHIQYAHA